MANSFANGCIFGILLATASAADGAPSATDWLAWEQELGKGGWIGLDLPPEHGGPVRVVGNLEVAVKALVARDFATAEKELRG